MYQIWIPTQEPALCACGEGGEIPQPQSGRDALIAYVKRGTARTSFGELSQTAYAGDVVTSALPAQVTLSPDAQCRWLLISQAGLTLCPLPAAQEPPPGTYVLKAQCSCPRPARLDQLFRLLMDTGDGEQDAQQKKALLMELILMELSGQQERSGGHSRRFGEILEWLQESYTQPFSLEELSLRFQYNKMYLCRLFRERMGETIYAYVTRLRMEKAMALLNKTQDAVKDIARQAGYPDEKQFIRAFRQHTGMTATQYRAQEASSSGDKGE